MDLKQENATFVVELGFIVDEFECAVNITGCATLTKECGEFSVSS